MKAGELNIGNWVLCNGLRTVIDESLMISIIQKDIRFTIEPIPLKGEWLSGFKRYLNSATGSWVYMFNGRKFFYQSVNTGEIFSYDNSRIRYVHQVQNLVFALMGEEI